MIEAYLKHEAERKELGVPPKPLDPEQTTRAREAPPEAAEGEGGVPPRAPARPRLPRRRSRRRGEGRVPRRRREGHEEVAAHRRSSRRSSCSARWAAATTSRRSSRPSRARRSPPTPPRRSRASPTSTTPSTTSPRSPRRRTPPRRRSSSPGRTPSGSPRSPACPATIKVKVFRVDGEINTDDFSPAGDASTRPDIPLHALAMGKTRFPGGLKTIAEYRAAGLPGRVRRRRGRHRLLPQVRLQQRAVGHRRRHPVRPEQAPRRRHHRRRHRADLLRDGAGLGRAPDQGRRLEAQDGRRRRGRHREGPRSAARRARCSRPSSSRPTPSPTSTAPAAASRSPSAAPSPRRRRSSRRRGRRTSSRRS